MKSNKINFLFILILFVIGCNKSDTIINTQVKDWNLDYKLNLERTDSGVHKSYATIQWDGYTEYDDFNYYSISFKDIIIEESDSSLTTYQIDLSPGEIINVKFEIYNDLNNIILMDSIQIYSRKVYPVTNLNYSVDGSYTHFLSWEASIENDFKHHKIYRSIDPSISLPFIQPNDCNESTNCINIATIEDNSIIEFIDSTTTGLGYSYIITTFDMDDLYTNSTLETGYSESANPIIGPNATDDLSDKIKISWDEIELIDQEEVYSIDIWRGTSANVTDNENHTKLVTIFDPSVNYYEDINNIGSATSWYYMIKLTNIYGRYSKSNEEIHGITQP